MYQIDIRVRYSEVGADKKASMAQIVDYFQDCSTFQSEDVGRGIRILEQERRAWLLCSWQIVVERYPEFGERLHVGTWPYDASGLYAYRNFDLIDEQGIRIASANSIWFYMNTETGKPVRVTAEDISVYGRDEKLKMEYAPRKVKPPKEFRTFDSFQILKMHIDTNQHVNNAQYIQIAQEFLPADFKIKQMRADYKKAAVLHDTVIPRVAITDNICTIELCDTQGKTYVIVEFTSI